MARLLHLSLLWFLIVARLLGLSFCEFCSWWDFITCAFVISSSWSWRDFITCMLMLIMTLLQLSLVLVCFQAIQAQKGEYMCRESTVKKQSAVTPVWPCFFPAWGDKGSVPTPSSTFCSWNKTSSYNSTITLQGRRCPGKVKYMYRGSCQLINDSDLRNDLAV